MIDVDVYQLPAQMVKCLLTAVAVFQNAGKIFTVSG